MRVLNSDQYVEGSPFYTIKLSFQALDLLRVPGLSDATLNWAQDKLGLSANQKALHPINS